MDWLTDWLIATDGTLEAENKMLHAQVSSLKVAAEQNTSLVWQVEGYKNEAEQFKQQYNLAVMEKNAQVSGMCGVLIIDCSYVVEKKWADKQTDDIF